MCRSLRWYVCVCLLCFFFGNITCFLLLLLILSVVRTLALSFSMLPLPFTNCQPTNVIWFDLNQGHIHINIYIICSNSNTHTHSHNCGIKKNRDVLNISFDEIYHYAGLSPSIKWLGTKYSLKQSGLYIIQNAQRICCPLNLCVCVFSMCLCVCFFLVKYIGRETKQKWDRMIFLFPTVQYLTVMALNTQLCLVRWIYWIAYC